MANYSKHIGRVGALAVALGVGVAVTGTTCPASASPDSATSSAGAKGDVHQGKVKNDKKLTPVAAVAVPKAVPHNSHAAPSPSAVVATVPQVPALPNKPTAVAWVAESSAATAMVTKTVVKNAVSIPVAATPAAAGGTAAPTHASVPVNPIKAFLALPATVITTAVDVVKTVLTAFTPTKPGEPANQPLLWALLAVVRREFFNLPTQVKYTVGQPDSSGKITISLNQTDTSGNPLRYTATDGAKGAVALNADGHSFTYTPAAGKTGTDTVTITATDPSISHLNGFSGLLNALSFGLLGSAGRTATANVTVTLNTPPTLTLSAGNPNADTGVVTVSAIAKDADGNPLTLSVTQGDSGSAGTPTVVDAATGAYAISYTPTDAARHLASSDTATAAQQSDSFSVTVNDGHGGVVTKTVSVAISPENAAPQYSTVSSSTDANGIVTGTVSFTDSNHDSLTYSGSTTTLKGAVVVNSDGSFTYTPSAGERNVAAVAGTTDTDQFAVSANDGHGGTGTTNVTVTILPAVLPPTPTPADIASDPVTALTTAQAAIEADTAAYQSVQASIGRSIIAYNTLFDPNALLNNLNQIQARAQVSLTAALAQLGLTTTSSVPTTQLENTIGPLTGNQLSNLMAEQQASVNAQQKLLASLNTAADAKAAVTAKTASAPVFNRVSYTVGGDGSITGQVYFVDPQGQSMTIYGVGDDILPHFNQSGTGLFTIPASVIANNPSPFGMYVEATDTGNNVTRVKVTFSTSTPSAPSFTTTQSQVLTDFSTIFSSLASSVGSFQSTLAEADAKRLEAQAQGDVAVMQTIDQTIDITRGNLANVLSTFIAAQENLTAGYASGALANLPS